MVTISKMREQLLEGFPEQQADLMARVFVSAHDELVTKAEFNELTAVVRELAVAQQRTELRVEELAEAQHELAEAQKQTEWAVRDLAKQVGGLSNALGGSLEDFACDLVPELLEKHWKMQVESSGPEELLIGRKHREIDLVIRGTIADKPVMVVCAAAITASFKLFFAFGKGPRRNPSFLTCCMIFAFLMGGRCDTTRSLYLRIRMPISWHV